MHWRLFAGMIFFAAAWAPARAGDDFPDVVVTDLDSLWVFHGDGTGEFATPIQYFVGEAVEPWSVAIGDLDGDGRPDVISANRFGPHATYLINKGNAEFEDARYLFTSQRPYDVDLGDLDGDGDQDIVITCNFDPGEVMVFYNDGKGGFADEESIYPGGTCFNS